MRNIPVDPPSDSEIAAVIDQCQVQSHLNLMAFKMRSFKYCDEVLFESLRCLIRECWEAEKVPDNFCDTNIVHIYTRTGDRSDCNNHRGISLLSVAGKILARVILDTILHDFDHDIIPESQCCSNLGVALLTWQSMDIFIVFGDLVRAS